MKTIIYSFIIVLLLQSCSFDFLGSSDDDAPEGVTKRYEFDSATDTKYYYEDDTLKWKEQYDYNASGECIFIKRMTPSDTTLWSYVYTWADGKVTSESYFNNENILSWFNTFNYSSINMTQHNNYNSSSQLQWFNAYSYSLSNKIETSTKYDNASTVQWAYGYEYDSSDRLITASSYSNNGRRIAYITHEYDGSDRKIKEEGFGEAVSSDTFYSKAKCFNFPTSGGENTLSRNTASLTAPSIPTAPTSSTSSLINDSLTYAWMNLWQYDIYGYSFATLDSNRLPTKLKRSAPDYLNNKPVVVDIEYTGTRVDSKTTTHNNNVILKLEFVYDSSNRPISIITTGEALLLPLTYNISYKPVGIPASIGIYNGPTMLQRFDYEYSVPDESVNINNIGEYISIIKHYDGDNTYLGSYNFSYDLALNKLTIAVKDSTDLANGEIVLQYDVNGHTSGLTSYSPTNEQIWDYSYSYDSFGNRVSETYENSNGVPQVVNTFDIETIFEDIKRYLP